MEIIVKPGGLCSASEMLRSASLIDKLSFLNMNAQFKRFEKDEMNSKFICAKISKTRWPKAKIEQNWMLEKERETQVSLYAYAT